MVGVLGGVMALKTLMLEYLRSSHRGQSSLVHSLRLPFRPAWSNIDRSYSSGLKPDILCLDYFISRPSPRQ